MSFIITQESLSYLRWDFGCAWQSYALYPQRSLTEVVFDESK